MSELEKDFTLYHRAIEDFRITEPKLISATQVSSNTLIQQLKGSLDQHIIISTLNSEISKAKTDVEIQTQEIDVLCETYSSLSAEKSRLLTPRIAEHRPIPAFSPPPRESLLNLKSQISLCEAEYNDLVLAHPAAIAKVRTQYAGKIQELKNELRLKKYFFVLSKRTLSYEAGIHSFVTREELQTDLGRASEANAIYRSQMIEAAIIPHYPPVSPTYQIPPASNSIQALITCLIFFLFSSFLCKLLISIPKP